MASNETVVEFSQICAKLAHLRRQRLEIISTYSHYIPLKCDSSPFLTQDRDFKRITRKSRSPDFDEDECLPITHYDIPPKCNKDYGGWYFKHGRDGGLKPVSSTELARSNELPKPANRMDGSFEVTDDIDNPTRPPEGTSEPESEASPIIDAFSRFMESCNEDPAQSLVFIGPCGAGKSTALHRLEQMLWRQLVLDESRDGKYYAPIALDLSVTRELLDSKDDGASFQEQALACMDDPLSMQDLEIMRRHDFIPVWFFDGFPNPNLLAKFSTKLHACGITVTTCTAQLLDARPQFILDAQVLTNNLPQNFYHLVYLRELNRQQVIEYVQQQHESFEVDEKSRYSQADSWISAIYALESLREFASNPGMLTLLIPSMPKLLEENVLLRGGFDTGSSPPISHVDSRVTRLQAIRLYFREYVERAYRSFATDPYKPADMEGFIHECQTYCEDLAYLMFKQGQTHIVASTYPDYGTAFLPSSQASPSPSWFVRHSVPIRRVGATKWAFTNNLLLSYFLTSRCLRADISRMDVLRTSCFAHNLDLLRWHAEIVVHHPHMRTVYVELVVASRTQHANPDEDQAIMHSASNAISILNYAQVHNIFPFSFETAQDDWSSIRIPDANLNKAILIRCNFDGADLSGASLLGALLYDSSFKNANLMGVNIGKRKIRFEGHQGIVSSVVYSPDGRLIASASDDATVRVWDADTGECKCILPANEDLITCVAFSPQGDTLVFGTQEGRIRIWNLVTGTCIRTLVARDVVVTPEEGQEGKDQIYAVAFNPTGTQILFVNHSKVRVWSLSETRCVCEKPAQTYGGYLALCLSEFYATTDWQHPDNTITTNSPASLTSRIGFAKCVAVSPDGGFVASSEGPYSSVITLWDVKLERRIAELHNSSHWVSSLAFCPQGRYLACAYNDGQIHVWDVRVGQRVMQFVDEVLPARTLCFHPNGQYLVGGQHHMVSIWKLPGPSPTEIRRFGHTDTITCVNFSPDSRYLASGADDTTVRVWDVVTHSCYTTLKGPIEPVQSVAFHTQNAAMVYGVCTARHFRTWDITTGTCIATYVDTLATTMWRRSGKGQCRLHVTPNGEELVLLDHRIMGDLVVQVVDLSTLKTTRWYAAEVDSHHAWAIDATGNSMGRGDDRHITTSSMYAWGDHPYKAPNTAVIKRGRFYSRLACAAFSPDTQYLAAGGWGGGIEIWNLTKGKCTANLRYAGDASETIWTIAFNPNGHALGVVSGEHRDRVRMWDIGTRQCTDCLHICKRDHVRVDNTCFSPDGRLFAASCSDRSIHVWEFVESPPETVVTQTPAATETASLAPLISPTSLASTPSTPLAVDGTSSSHWRLKCILSGCSSITLAADFENAQMDPEFQDALAEYSENLDPRRNSQIVQSLPGSQDSRDRQDGQDIPKSCCTLA